ncbi:MAG: fumarylacetoacetate hydrolase family protein [Bdellovibrionota bacterium]
MDKIICIGKNYLEHAKELNKMIGDSIPDKPVIFFKPPSVIQQTAHDGIIKATLPQGHGQTHHECEIALRITKDCHRISPKEAESYFDAVTLGLDMTLRDLQAHLKKSGHPWEMAKSFKDSILLGPWIELNDFKDFLNTEFSFSINGEVKQKSFGKKMTLNPYECLSYASEYFEIKKGDILFTGTPEGVGAVQRGDLGSLEWGSHLKSQIQW